MVSKPTLLPEQSEHDAALRQRPQVGAAVAFYVVQQLDVLEQRAEVYRSADVILIFCKATEGQCSTCGARGAGG